ncbi:MAG: response regulator [Anaerolineae bacterium]|nr:response regulator [Anaerolineae bacterium]NIN98265.1 response regulator [Anaerolineae bacterium]NIQ81194.1 response regulator [Anaerolineae bacterium]
MTERILIVDDEETLCYFLKESLEEKGYQAVAAYTAREGLDVVAKQQIDLVLLDLKLPDGDGLDVLYEIRKVDSNLPVIVLTAHAAVESAVQAMKLGAYDYLEKPINLEELSISAAKALESRAMRQEIQRLRFQQDRDQEFIVGESKRMQDIMRLIERVAPSKASVLIQGESGTGKEVVAHAIHDMSPRGKKGFVPINCAAIPDTLMETELFGYEAGAFTDARRQKLGLIEMADGGTLFLDEISTLKPELQAKLLRILETESMRRLGGMKDVHVDLRVIAATNRDLREAIAEGTFREDLFYRLSVVVIDIPPLRERIEDVDRFAAAFIADFNKTRATNVQAVSDDALRLMRQYEWPGNVRELRNVIERAMILCNDDVIDVGDLPAEIVSKEPGAAFVGNLLPIPPVASGVDMKATIADIEKRMIKEALASAQGNKSQAARLLGVSRDVLNYSMQKYGLQVDQ